MTNFIQKLLNIYGTPFFIKPLVIFIFAKLRIILLYCLQIQNIQH